MRVIFADFVAFSVLNALFCSAPVQAKQNKIEVIQVVQSLDQDVSLVASKATMVRIYLDGSENQGRRVTGRLEITQGDTGRTTTIDAANSVDVVGVPAGSIADQHDDLRKSLNFVVPADWTVPGRVSFRLSEILQSPGKQPLSCSSCATVIKPVSFKAPPPLKVKVVFVGYNVDGISPFAYPSSADLAEIKSWLRRTYPVSEIILSSGVIDAQANNLTGHFTCSDLNDALGAIRLVEVTRGGVDKLTHYYGLVSDKYFLMAGCSTVPDTPDARVVASGAAGNPAHHSDYPSIYWDKSSIFTGWYAGHEIAHTFGRAHPGKCGESHNDSYFPYEHGHLSNSPEKYVGLDMGEKTDGSSAVVLPGLKWADLMTYCSDLWISKYTFDGILTRLYAENGLDPNGGPGLVLQGGQNTGQTPGGKFIDIIASVNFSKSVATFKFVQKADSPYFQLANEEGEAIIRTLDATGKLIHAYRARVHRNTDLNPDVEQIGAVRTSIPYDDQISTLELAVSEKIKAVYSAGGSRAVVNDLVVKNAVDLTGEEFSVMTSASQAEGISKGILVRWKSVGSGVTYTVEISIDNKGKLWSTLATGLTKNYLAIAPNKLGLDDGREVLVRVTANDGFRSTAVDTRNITIGKRQ
jgi:hypothetical protein